MSPTWDHVSWIIRLALLLMLFGALMAWGEELEIVGTQTVCFDDPRFAGLLENYNNSILYFTRQKDFKKLRKAVRRYVPSGSPAGSSRSLLYSSVSGRSSASMTRASHSPSTPKPWSAPGISM